jgi:putative endonuclease
MASHNELGDKGEEIALQYLRKKNYKIKETNWRCGKDEIDIIAMDKGTLVIVEVKTRSANYIVKPEFAVNKNKQRFLIRAANSYIFAKDLDLETRFDIISIVVYNNRNVVEHIEDAFYPTR